MQSLLLSWRKVVARFFTVLTLGVCLACAPRLSPTTHFDASAALSDLEEGSNTITGRASIISPNGFTRTCEYDGVSLIPVTAYSNEWMSLVFGSQQGGYARHNAYERLSGDDGFDKYARRGECDEAGRFRFEHVANGKYFVVSKITWLLRWTRSGGALAQTVEVSGGQSKQLLLEKRLER